MGLDTHTHTPPPHTHTRTHTHVRDESMLHVCVVCSIGCVMYVVYVCAYGVYILCV